MASTIHAGVNTSPWSATRFRDLIRLIGKRLQATTRNYYGIVPNTILYEWPCEIPKLVELILR